MPWLISLQKRRFADGAILDKPLPRYETCRPNANRFTVPELRLRKTLSLRPHRAISKLPIPLRHIGAVGHVVLGKIASAGDLAELHSISFVHRARQR